MAEQSIPQKTRTKRIEEILHRTTIDGTPLYDGDHYRLAEHIIDLEDRLAALEALHPPASPDPKAFRRE